MKSRRFSTYGVKLAGEVTAYVCREGLCKLPTNDPNAPGRPNGYAGRMHKHIATPISDYFPWEEK